MAGMILPSEIALGGIVLIVAKCRDVAEDVLFYRRGLDPLAQVARHESNSESQ